MSSENETLKTDSPDALDMVDILIVDDQTENLISMEALLTSPHLRLALLGSGKEALRAVLEHDFALILLDVQMPVMDGFETAEIIRQRERSRTTPIIFVTAINKSERNIFQGYTYGAVDYIFKPFMPETLKAKVDVFVELYRKMAETRSQKERIERINNEWELYSQALISDIQATMRRISAHDLLIEQRLTGSSEVQIADLGRALVEDSRKNRQLFASMLDFTQTMNREFDFKQIAISILCQETIQALTEEAGYRAVKWQISELPQVQGDETMLRVVFRNLLLNALRFTKDVESAILEVSSYRDGEVSIIYIKDNGPGFFIANGNDFSTVSEQFGSLEAFEGIGISLAVSQRIIRGHGGQIWVQSVPGKGSTVFFTLQDYAKKSKAGIILP